MKVQINVANNLLKSAEEMIKSLNTTSEKYYVIVPDRFSLTAEKQILNILKTKCCFNVEVLTLSRLCNRYIKTENKKLLSKNESVMLIRKCILENQNKLQCFKNSSKTENFSEEIFETIMQLKSCNITPSNIKQENLATSLNLKLQDIKCIYECYENYLKNDYIDSFNKLNLFCENMFKYDALKTYNVCFAYFDNFTPLILKVINNLMRTCKSVNFALQLASENQNNAHIFEHETYEQILLEAKSLDITPIIISSEDENNLQNFLRTNLYSYSNNKQVASTIIPNLISFSNIQNEIEYICTDINRRIIENKERYFNFAIACANSEKYFLEIKNQMEKFNIPCYLDASKKLSETVLNKLIYNCLSYFNVNKGTSTVFNLIDNPIINLSSDEINSFKNFCIKYNIQYGFQNSFKVGKTELNFNDCEKTRKNLFNFINLFSELKNCENANDFSNVLKIFLNQEQFINSYNNFLQKLEFIDKFQYQIEKQAYDKFLQIIENISNILNNQNLTLTEFIEIFKSGVDSCNISSLPLSVDCVFVGDINNSVFINTDNLYICGASNQNFPAVKQDVGLISDFDIKKLSEYLIIEPSIRIINRRNRLKCVQLASSFNKSLTISYAVVDGGGTSNTASEILKQTSNLINVFNSETKSFIPLPILNEELLYANSSNWNLNKLCVNYVNNKNATTKIISEIKNNPLIKSQENFKDIEKIYNFLNEKSHIFNFFLNHLTKNNNTCEFASELMFKNNKTSISQIETYFACPFKHFVKYVLKLKENENSENLTASIGTLLHGVAEFFVNYELENNFNVKEEIINDLAVEFFNKSLIENKLQYISENSENKLIISDLINESQRMCAFLHNAIKQSKFKPVSTEQGFGEKNEYKQISLQVKNKQFKIDGKIDRIDAYKDKFYIIDYKTGSTTFDFADLFYGNKVQLFVYQFAIEEQANKQAVGVFYMPIKNTFSADVNSQSYQLDGVVVNDVEIAREMDSKLDLENPSSKIIPAKLVIDKQTNQLTVKSNTAVNLNTLHNLSEYAVLVCKQALEEMLQDYIAPKPIKNGQFSSCSFCSYKNLCKFNAETDGYRKKQSVKLFKGEEE